MPNKTILIADDERDMVETISLKLKAEGFDIITAYNGIQALESAKTKKPDLILLDIVMPELNGYQVCRELKKNNTFKQIPIIMLTAKAQESDKFWGKETGADEYLTKPFEFSILINTIKKYLFS